MLESPAVDRVRANLAGLYARLATAARRAGRDPDDVVLMGASKEQPPELVAAAVQAGLRYLGENRVQEAAAKRPEVERLLNEAGTPLPEWHLIGHLQTNKVRAACQLFSRIQSVDSVRLAEALSARVLQASARSAPISVNLEVYVGDDAERPGFRPAELHDAVGRLLEMPGIAVRGLMTVAPLGGDATQTRRAFRQVREVRDALSQTYPRVHWIDLSMGMTEDFEIAIEEGSTMVRIGRALFGPRTKD